MNRRLLRGLIAGAGLLAIVTTVIAVAPLLVPTTSLRGAIESRVAHATGRDFRINGALTFSLFPTLGFDAHGVTLANVPGGRARSIVRVDAMRIAVKLWPLLHGRVEATQIELDRPIVALEVTPDGTANWELVRKHAQASSLRVPANTVFAGVTIRDGTVSYDNNRLDIHRTIGALDATVALTRLALPVTVQGRFVHRAKPFAFKATVGTFGNFLAGQATQTDLSIASPLLEARFKGTVARDGTASGFGSVRTISLTALAAWLGRPVTAGNGLRALAACAQLMARDRRIALTHIKATLDGMAIAGDLSADLRGKVPTVSSTLAIDRLDLNTYVRLGQPGMHRAAGPPGGGWSKAPIRLDLIKLVNGHLSLTVGSLRLLRLQTGKAAMTVLLQDGLMTAHLEPMRLYDSSGKADLAVDVRGPVPAFHNTLTLAGVAMKPFLADTIGVDKLEGRGSITFDIASKGASPDAVMRALSGKGAVSVDHGSIHGVDLGQIARTVESLLSAGATGDGAVTDFDHMGGSFTIQNGILWNGDLRLDSAFIHMTGQGHLDLGNQTIAYRIEPKASIGGGADILDVGVPFTITGSWAHLRYVPDLSNAVGDLLGGVLGRDAAPLAGLLEGLLGGGRTQDQASPTPVKKKHKSTGDVLRNMLGLH